MKATFASLACLTVLCLITGKSHAVDRQRRISQYAHTAWRLQDGYLSGTPNAITQTKDGYIWIGTQNGLVRFDGIRFVPWTAPRGFHLRFPSIDALAPAEEGGLWIGTAGGLDHWTGEKLVNFQPGGHVNQIFRDGKGDTWIARSRTRDSLGGLCKVVDEHLECHGKADGFSSPDAGPLAGDAHGNLWVGATDSLIRWSAGHGQTYVIRELGAAHGLSGVQGIAVARDDSVWIGLDRSGRGLGLQHLVNGIFTSIHGPSFDSSSLKVVSLFSDREGVLWVGTFNRGIFRIDGDKVDHFDSTDGLSGDSINGFAQDQEGNIWVATTKGVDNFRDLPVATFSKQQGLSSDQAASITAAPDGTVWIGNLDSLDALRDVKVSSIKLRQGLPGQQVTSLLVDHSGVLWIGVDNGLYRYINGRFLPILGRDAKPIGFVQSLAEDKDQNIWASASQGHDQRVVQIRDGKVQQAQGEADIRGGMVFAGPDGNLWLNIRPGTLAQFRGGRFTTYALEHSKDFGNLFSPFIDADGSIWASSRLGEVLFRDGAFHVLSESNGLPCNQIYTSIEDRNGALWLYAECGLIRIDNSEIKRWLSKPDSKVTSQTLDVYAGAQASLATFSPMATRSSDGRLWFANDNLVQMIDPDHLQLNQLPPPVHIEQLIANEQVYSFRDKLVLPPKTKDLQIDYTALSFVAPRRVHFRVKLVGHDSQWRDVDNRRSAFYTNLGPGAYRFLVRGCNNAGVWNEQGASLDFSITPAWYQTLWFQISCGFAFLNRLLTLSNASAPTFS